MRRAIPGRDERQMTAAGSPPSRAGGGTGRRNVEVSISIRTILLIAGAVAIAWALASIANVLLVIFVSRLQRRRSLAGREGDGAAVGLESGAVLRGARAGDRDRHRRRSRWCWCRRSAAQCAGSATTCHRSWTRSGTAISAASSTGGSGSLDTLRQHASDIASGVGKVSGGVAHVGVSAFGAVTLVFSVIFLTLFGLVDEPRLRDWIGGLLYRDKRERYLRVTDRIIQTTSRYMLGNLAISVICGTVYGITAVILGLPYPLAMAVIAGILDLIPTIGATIAGIIIGIVALSVSVEALIAFVIVIVVYQQIENYILQPTIIGKAAAGLRLHRACQRPGVRGALRHHRRDHRRADRGRAPDRRRGAHRREKSSHRRRRRRRAAPTGLTARLTLPRPPESRRTRDDASPICR